MTGQQALQSDNARIAVVGAAGDIGAATVRLLLDQGAQVVAVDRDVAALDTLAGVLGSPAGLLCLAADVSSETAMADVFGAIAKQWGGLTGLVNGAGIEGSRTTIDLYPLEVFRTVLDVNITGVFLGMKYGIPLLREHGGAIVNIASTAGIKGAEGMSAYSASKHAVIGLTRTAAIEWGRQGIRVNAVCPGPIEGRMIEAIYASGPGTPSLIPADRAAQIPSRRFGTPDEVADVIAYLLTGAPDFVNGAAWQVDGGISAI